MELVDLPVVVLTTVLPGQVVKRGQVNGFFFWGPCPRFSGRRLVKHKSEQSSRATLQKDKGHPRRVWGIFGTSAKGFEKMVEV